MCERQISHTDYGDRGFSLCACGAAAGGVIVAFDDGAAALLWAKVDAEQRERTQDLESG
jgi:hypothetical protein